MKSLKYLGLAAFLMVGINLCAEDAPAAEKAADAPSSLWVFDKTNFEVGDISNGKWLASGLDGKTTDNGFIITKDADKNGGSMTRYVEINPSHQYFCFKILKAENLGGYFCLYAPDIKYYKYAAPALVSKILPGYYSFKGSMEKELEMTTCRFDMYGANIEFAFMGMFDKPEYIVFSNDTEIKIGDELVINFESLKPVESVIVELFQAYSMPQLSINGQAKLDLTAVNAEKTKWQLKVKLESIKGQSATKPFEPGAVLIKANVNGKFDVFGTNPAVIKF